MRHTRFALMLFTLMAAFGAPKAQAALVAYTYTGNNFNTISGAGITTADFLSGSIIVDCGLLGGAGDCASLPLANYIPAIMNFSFSGAGITIDDSTSFLLAGMFSTDATGMIVDWNIQSQNAVPSFATISGPSCYTFYDSCDQLSTLNGTGYTFDDPGAWSATIVPIPAAVWLFVSGLLGLVGVARRKKA